MNQVPPEYKPKGLTLDHPVCCILGYHPVLMQAYVLPHATRILPCRVTEDKLFKVSSQLRVIVRNFKPI